MIKRTISEREGTKIRNNIRLDFQPPTVAQLSVKRPVIHENRASIIRVKPHHAATRRHIKNTLHSIAKANCIAVDDKRRSSSRVSFTL